MAKRLPIKYDYDQPTVVWTPEGGDPVEFDFNQLPKDIQKRVKGAGLHHILRDRTSAESDPEAKLAAAKEVFDRLAAGEYVTRRVGAGAARTTLLVAAVARLKGIEESAAKELVGGLSDEQVKQLRSLRDVKKAILAVKEERLREQETEETVTVDDILA